MRRLLPLTALLFCLLAPSASAVTVSSPSVTEGGALQFEVIVEAFDGPVTVETENGTASAPDDYTTESQTFLVPGTFPVTVPTIQDSVVEANETVILRAAPDVAGTGTIVDDEPVIGIRDQSFAENTGTAQVVVDAARTTRDVPVSYSIAGDPADVTAASGTVTIPAGQTRATIPVALVGDTVDEDDETFTVTLTSVDGVGVLDGSGTITIANDDLRQLSIGDVTAREGDGQNTVVRVPLTLSAPTHRTVTVQFATFDLTARAPRDYLSRLATATIAPGQTSAVLEFAVVADNVREGTEQFGVVMGKQVGAGIARAGAAITITDDDDRSSANSDDDVSPNMRVTSFRRTGNAIGVRVGCPRNEQRCRGRVTFYTVGDRRSKVRALRRERRLGRKSFSLRGGQARTLRLAVPRSVLGAARRAGRLRLRAFVVTEDANENTGTTTRRATLRFRR